MTTKNIIAAGFGGQGIMAMGQLIICAGMIEGKYVSYLPSYGPEMRGGSANCSLVVSTEPVGSPVISAATDVIVMNGPSLKKFENNVVPGGNLFINASLCNEEPTRDDINIFKIPVSDLAKELGNAKVANMIMLGAFIAATEFIKVDSAIQAFTKVYGAKKKKLLPINEKAIATGMDLLKASGCVDGVCSISLDKSNTKVNSKYARQREENIELSSTDIENIDYLKNIKTYTEEDDEKIFESELSIIDEALNLEKESIRYYDKAAEMLEGDIAEETFKSLSNQSDEHVSYLEGLKSVVSKDDKVSFTDKIKGAFSSKDEYDWGKVDTSKVRLALNVFSIGLKIKGQTIKFYKKAEEKSEIEEAKKLYKELAYWEDFQLEQLRGQYEVYRDEWWADQLFSRS